MYELNLVIRDNLTFFITMEHDMLTVHKNVIAITWLLPSNIDQLDTYMYEMN